MTTEASSPDGYISAMEARDLYGIDPMKLRSAAVNRSWWDSVTFRVGQREVNAWDIDQVLGWHWGCEEKPDDTRPCMRCGKKSMPGRYYCPACAELRAAMSGVMSIAGSIG